VSLLLFLLEVVGISLCAVMAPGPVTAAALAAGTRSRHAGALIAVGHGIVEMPLILLIITGIGNLLKLPTVQVAVGFAGGFFLLFIGGAMLRSLRKSLSIRAVPERNPIAMGIILSVANPYFLLWWATVGLNLATKARQLGPSVFVAFVIVHWLCDLFWFEVLSWASFKGSKLLGKKIQRGLLLVAGCVLLIFAAVFLCDAGTSLYYLMMPIK